MFVADHLRRIKLAYTSVPFTSAARPRFGRSSPSCLASSILSGSGVLIVAHHLQKELQRTTRNRATGRAVLRFCARAEVSEVSGANEGFLRDLDRIGFTGCPQLLGENLQQALSVLAFRIPLVPLFLGRGFVEPRFQAIVPLHWFDPEALNWQACTDACCISPTGSPRRTSRHPSWSKSFARGKNRRPVVDLENRKSLAHSVTAASVSLSILPSRRSSKSW
jgi:hypothetical protein